MAVKKSVKEVATKVTAEATAKRIQDEAMKENPMIAALLATAEKARKGLESFVKTEACPEAIKNLFTEDISNAVTEKIDSIKEVFGIDAQASKLVDVVNGHNVAVAELDAEKSAYINELEEKIASLEDTYERKNAELEQAHEDAEADWNRQTELAHRSKKQELEDELAEERKKHNDEVSKFYADKKTIEGYVAEIKELEEKIAELTEEVSKAEEKGKAIGKKKAEDLAAADAKLVKAEHDAVVQKLEFANEILKEKLADAVTQRDEAKEDARKAQEQLKEVSLGFAKNANTTVNFSSDRK